MKAAVATETKPLPLGVSRILIEIFQLSDILNIVFTRKSTDKLRACCEEIDNTLRSNPTEIQSCLAKLRAAVDESIGKLEVAPAPFELVSPQHTTRSRWKEVDGRLTRVDLGKDCVLRYDQLARCGGPSWELLGHSTSPVAFINLNTMMGLAFRAVLSDLERLTEPGGSALGELSAPRNFR